MKWLLFESFHLAQNHKLDVLIIAKMLKSQGEDVSIFDIFHEYNEDVVDSIPILHWKSNITVPDDSWMLQKHSFLYSFWKGLQYGIHKDRYMRAVKNFIVDKADFYYCGSYHNNMSTVLFGLKKPCFWWGLRSERFHFSISKMLHRPYRIINLLIARIKFLSNSNQYLFVSNSLILEEHVRMGIPRNRMVIREERCIEGMPNPNYNLLNKTFTFLTIGLLRPDKRIEFTINEFLKITNQCQYVLVGKAQESYEDVINSSINAHKNIVRVNKFLDYSEFNLYFQQAQFVVLADKQQEGSVTNGTFLESLINFRPVIAPNYNPYKYYIDKYQIGILFDPNVPGDLANAMQKAIDKGSRYYENKIREFLKTIQFENLSKKLYHDIYSLVQ
ncbi:MAG: glycosyltransferase [Bacteroidaceae bacterium]|nr:glycosyltransferase [Bacteroidaceae bacterium]